MKAARDGGSKNGDGSTHSRSLAPARPVTQLPGAASQHASWVVEMRRAAQAALSAEDVTQIVQKQVEQAKAGDKAALRFVFDLLLAVPKGMTLVQNNFTTPSDELFEKTPARGGSREKLDLMAQRVAAGLPATRDDDGPDVDLD